MYSEREYRAKVCREVNAHKGRGKKFFMKVKMK
jgi:hypothetical protein